MVGQQGLSHYNYNGSGGGGSFIAKGSLLTHTTPLLVAGGGGGGGIQYNQTQLHQNPVWVPKPTMDLIHLEEPMDRADRAAHLKVQGVVAVSLETDMERLIHRVIMENLSEMEDLEEMEIQILGTADLEAEEAFTGIIQVAEVEVAILVVLEEVTIIPQHILAEEGGSFNSGTNQQNTAGVNQGHGKIIISIFSSSPIQEAPLISQGTGTISKVTPEDTLTTWTTSELNATDSDTIASQLSWSVLTPPSNGTAVVDGNGTSPQTFTYLPDANYHGNDSFSVMVSDGDANDSITINLTINPVDDPAVISDGLLIYSTFSFTGADQTYAIPSGTEKLYIKLWGAGGGTGGRHTKTQGWWWRVHGKHHYGPSK